MKNTMIIARNFSIRFVSAFVLGVFMIGVVQADISVIVHPTNPEAALDATQVKKLYLGKAKRYPSGGAAMAIDYQEGHPVRFSFYSAVVKKTEAQAKSYWSKLVFTGKGTPPTDVAGEAEVMEFVSSNPKAIGFVDSASVTDSVKVVLTVP